jgi:hypothetical protein
MKKRTREEKIARAKRMKKRLAQKGYDHCPRCKKEAEDNVKHVEAEEGPV